VLATTPVREATDEQLVATGDGSNNSLTLSIAILKNRDSPPTCFTIRQQRNELKINNNSLGMTNVNQMKKSALLILAATAVISLVAITARAQNPNVVVNKIYVTSFKSAKVRVFLTNGMPTKPNVKTQKNPAGVAVASNGHIYVANFGANTVTTYDAAGKPISPTITGLSGSFALA